MKIPCFVISYNRPTFLRKCVEALAQEERLKIYVVDNNSSSESVKKMFPELRSAGIGVYELIDNCGHKAVWDYWSKSRPMADAISGFEIVVGDNPYVVTDCDIVVPSKLPWLDVLLDGMERLPQYNKFGLGLNTRHIPYNYPQREQVIHHENKVIYRRPFGDHRFVEMPVDTTLALYRAGYTKYSIWGNDSPIQYTGECKSVRTFAPYEATHLTWQMKPEGFQSEEHLNYVRSIKPGSTHWSR